MSDFATLAFLLLIFLACLGASDERRVSSLASRLFGFISVTATCVSLVMTYIAVFKIGQVCQLCYLTALCFTTLATCHSWVRVTSLQQLRPKVLRLGIFTASFLAVTAALAITILSTPEPRLINEGLVARTSIDKFDVLASPRIGSQNARNLIIVFTDFRCGACAQAHLKLGRLIAKHRDYAMIVKHFPVHEASDSVDFAELSEIANASGRFEVYSAWLFRNSNKGVMAAKNELDAVGVHLTAGSLRSARALVQRDRKLAIGLEIRGTPVCILAKSGSTLQTVSVSQLESMFDHLD